MGGLVVANNPVRALGEENEAEVEAEPEHYVPDAGVSCYTRFESTLRPNQILGGVNFSLQQMPSRHLSTSDHRIRADVLTELGWVSLQAQVFTDTSVQEPNAPQRYVCEIRRRKVRTASGKHIVRWTC